MDSIEGHGGYLHIIMMVVLLRNLYANQKAAVKTEFGETEQLDIGKGVRQGFILSAFLLTTRFNQTSQFVHKLTH